MCLFPMSVRTEVGRDECTPVSRAQLSKILTYKSIESIDPLLKGDIPFNKSNYHNHNRHTKAKTCQNKLVSLIPILLCFFDLTCALIKLSPIIFTSLYSEQQKLSRKKAPSGALILVVYVNFNCQ